MTIMLFNYPILPVLFAVAAVCVVLTAALKKYNYVPAIVAGLSAVTLVIYSLVVSLPMYELLSMLLALSVVGVFTLPKRGKK